MPCYARQACLPARQAVGQKSISQHAQWCTTIARTHIRLQHDPLATSFDVSLLLNQSSTLCGRQAAPTNRGLRKNLLATGLIRSIRPQGDRCLKKHRGNRKPKLRKSCLVRERNINTERAERWSNTIAKQNSAKIKNATHRKRNSKIPRVCSTSG
jgi:hypothetical protein